LTTDLPRSTDVGGSVVLLRALRLAGEAEQTAAFNAARDREYGESSPAARTRQMRLRPWRRRATSATSSL
jgi:hypothetical protein